MTYRITTLYYTLHYDIIFSYFLQISYYFYAIIYYSYKVISKASRKDFNKHETIVIRRYSDFLWLFDEFTKDPLFNGSIIPTLPGKQSVGRFSPEFVEARRRGLEKFLQRLGDHPCLG